MAVSDILLKLVLKGVEPAEAQRIATASLGTLETELKQSLQRQQQLWETAKNTANAQSRFFAQQELADARKHAAGLSQVIRGTATNWHRLIEEIANVTIIARNAWGIIAGGAERLKSLGDSMARTEEIYGLLRGTIDGLREATGGEVADMDLVISKNQATQLELKLTDEQFRIVGAGAKLLSKGLGTDTTQALQQMIESLATGRKKTLEMMGAIDSAKKSIQDYADRHGLAVKALSEHQERVAKLEGVLRTLDRKLVESGDDAEGFANKWQQASAKLKNAFDQIQLETGPVVNSIVDFFTEDIPNAIAKMVLKSEEMAAKFKVAFLTIVDPLSLFTKDSKADARASVEAAAQAFREFNDMLTREQIDAEKKRSSAVEDARKRLADRSGKAYIGEGHIGGDTTPGNTEIPEAYRAYFSDYERDAAARQKEEEKAIEDQHAANIARAERQLEQRPFQGGYATNDTIDKFNAAQAKLMERARQMREDLKNLGVGNEQVGGWLSQLIFGADGPQTVYDQMTDAQKFTYDVTQQMAEQFHGVGESMAGAFGQSAAAAIGENKNFKNALRDSTHAVMMALSAQAFAKAAFETAEGIASLALGPFGGASASAHFAAAAAFAGVGLLAGAGARATYSAPSTAASAGATGGLPTSTRPRATQDVGDRRSQEAAPVNLVINVAPGGESEAGRSVMKALLAYRQQTGTDVLKTLAMGS